MIAPEPPPTITPVVVPIPFAATQLGAQIDGIRIGSTRHEARLMAGYVWSRNYYFDPAQARPNPLVTSEGQFVQANRWELRGAWGWKLERDVTLYLDGYGLAGGPAATGGYDDPYAGGASVLGGPVMQLSRLDARDFPTQGWQARGGYGWGRHWGGTAFDFQRVSLDMVRFHPLGADSTVAVRGVLLAAWPHLAWLDKFSAGGGQFVRGFQWNRFTGDRLAAATVEHRWRFEPDLLPRLGLGGVFPRKVGLASVAFVDAGRVWEGRQGVGLPFPLDLRLGAGFGIITMVNGVPASRFELAFSEEGFFPVASGGTSF